MTEHFKFAGIVDGCFYSKGILFVVQLDRIFIDPMADTHAIVKIGNTGHNCIVGPGIRTA